MITISIDVTLLDKARFKEVNRRNGSKAVFAELILIDSPNSEYGDYIVKQQVTKEERAARKEMPILGNGKVLDFKKGGPSAKHTTTPEADEVGKPQDDVPF